MKLKCLLAGCSAAACSILFISGVAGSWALEKSDLDWPLDAVGWSGYLRGSAPSEEDLGNWLKKETNPSQHQR